MKPNKQMKRSKSINLQNESSGSAWKNFFSSQGFIAVFALVFLIVLFFPLAKSYTRRVVAEKEINEMRDKISEVEKVNKELAALIDYSLSLQAAEEHARGSYNLKTNGEGVVIIEEDSESEIARVEDEKINNSTSLQLWWSYFFK